MTRAHIHAPRNLGERAADKVAELLGSWRGLAVMTLFIVLWISLNTLPLIYHWDPMPFILLNLVFSTQAFYAAPIILMSQNRQATRDRVRDNTEASEVSRMFALQEQQMDYLETLVQRGNAQHGQILERIDRLEAALNRLAPPA
jgi:uncharacterized membrane protein